MKRRRLHGNMAFSGFTLLEVLVAIMILGTVLSTVFASYSGTFRIVSETEAQAEIYSMARTALERMLEDLESVYVPGKGAAGPSGEQQNIFDDDESLPKFEGKDDDLGGRSADSMHFPSRAYIVFGEEDHPWNLVTIRYYVEQDERSGALTLFRSEQTLWEDNRDEASDGLPLCNNLAFVTFQYMGSEDDEQDGWDPEEGMPRMVTISLGFVNPSNPETPIPFTTSIALPAITGDGTEGEWAPPW